MKSHHEKLIELQERYKAILADFNSTKNEYNTMYDIATDYDNLYPRAYRYLGEAYLSLGLPSDMTAAQFNDYLNYMEKEFLSDYELLRNDQSGSIITTEYKHKTTGKQIQINFYHSQCKTIKTGKLIEESKTICTWGE